MIELTEVAINSDKEFKDFLDSLGHKNVKFANMVYPVRIPLAIVNPLL